MQQPTPYYADRECFIYIRMWMHYVTPQCIHQSNKLMHNLLVRAHYALASDKTRAAAHLLLSTICAQLIEVQLYKHMQSEPPCALHWAQQAVYYVYIICTHALVQCEMRERACIMTVWRGKCKLLSIHLYVHAGEYRCINFPRECVRQKMKLLRSWLRRKLNCDTVNNFKAE